MSEIEETEVPALATAEKMLPPTEEAESFGDLLSQFEKSHARNPEDGSRQIEATVIAITADSALFDIGFKTEEFCRSPRSPVRT